MPSRLPRRATVKPLTLALSRREGGTLNCAPSADAVAGGGDRGADPHLSRPYCTVKLLVAVPVSPFTLASILTL